MIPASEIFLVIVRSNSNAGGSDEYHSAQEALQGSVELNNNNNNNRIERRRSRYFTISSLRCEPPPVRTLKWPWRNHVQIMCNTSNAYHVQHVALLATRYEGTAQLLSLTELKSHLFELHFIG